MSRLKAFLTFLSRNYSSSSSSSTAITKLRKLKRFPPFSNIRSEYKSQVVEQAQKALREYLHETRSLPFLFAEKIAYNSLVCLSKLLRKVRFSAPTFSRTFKSLLRYEPINEFEFFLESIGVASDVVPRVSPPCKLLSEDQAIIDSAFALFEFGFPWNTIGKLYVDQVSIFRKSPAELTESLLRLKQRLGFDSLSVVGVSLAFPRLLSAERDFGGDFDNIFDALIRVFEEFDRTSSVEGNVDAWYELCCKVSIFDALGCDKEVGELMCKRRELFAQTPKEVLVRTVDYLAKFGAGEAEVGSLLLRSPEILSLDLDSPPISVSGLLKHFGLSAEALQRVRDKYPHVFGRNKMANLPLVAKALGLHEWCFEKIKASGGQILQTYAIGRESDKDRDSSEAWKRIESMRATPLMLSKVEFLKGIGFGENAVTIKLLSNLHGSSGKLRARFDLFLRLGFEHSILCLMIVRAPLIICQDPKKVEEKVNFLRREMGSPLQALADFPRFLHFDLDNRIKRRYRFYVWLREKGLCEKKYSIVTMLKSDERSFVGRVFRIHPAAPKHYLERF